MSNHDDIDPAGYNAENDPDGDWDDGLEDKWADRTVVLVSPAEDLLETLLETLLDEALARAPVSDPYSPLWDTWFDLCARVDRQRAS